MQGVIKAVEDLEDQSGRTLLDAEKQLLRRAGGYGPGVDLCVATISAGPPIKVLIVGLLDDVSIESARQLIRATYVGEVQTLSLKNRGTNEGVIDDILRSRPDLIIAVGGVENGADRTLLSLLEPVGMAFQLMDESSRPEILFAGNQAGKPAVISLFGESPRLHFSLNIRPSVDQGQVEIAVPAIGEITVNIRNRQLDGVASLLKWTDGHLIHAPLAFGRIIRFFSQAYQTSKGVLGVYIDPTSITLAAALGGRLALNVHAPPWPGEPSEFASGDALELHKLIMLPEITSAQVDAVSYQRAYAPASLPQTPEDLEVEQALLRLALKRAVRELSGFMPDGLTRSAPGQMPWFEPILASGYIKMESTSHPQTCLALLDGLQPCGVTTLVLDQKNLIPILGAAAEVNPTLVVQVIDSDDFLHLATVITPVGDAPSGTPILRVQMTYQDGRETTLDIKQGMLEVLPLAIGQSARIHLQPFHRYEVGMGGAGRGGGLRVTGSALGVVIDARGRPIKFSDDPFRRHELYKKWLWTLGD
jgi:hypothetical protein